jgi:SAM-dependent methyltransferase
VGRLEFLSVQEVVRRLLPGGGLRVLDVGGGTGVHAAWLAGDGHRVTLVDPVASQVDVARGLEGVEAVVADANRLAALTNRLGLRVDPSGYYRRSHEEEWTMLRTGLSRGHREGTFPTAHLHTPAEIAGEFDEVGLAVAGQYSVQGLACFAPGLAVLLHDETRAGVPAQGPARVRVRSGCTPDRFPSAHRSRGALTRRRPAPPDSPDEAVPFL